MPQKDSSKRFRLRSNNCASIPGIGTPKALQNPALAGLRSWPVKGFSAIRVYYLTSEKMLRIVRVLHGKRDINPMLEDESMDSE
jgi:toxin ParE1/3/4